MQEADRLIVEGNRHEDAGEFDIALTFYKQALVAKSDYPRAHMNIGNALERLKRFEEAASAFREALLCSAEYAPARFNLGRLLVASGKEIEAERELREVLRLEPDMAEASVALANVLESSGRAVEAEAELRRALELRPDYAGAELALGILYLHKHRLDEAEALLLKGQKADWELAQLGLGMLYLEAGRVSEATQASRTLEQSDRFPMARSEMLFSLNFHADLDAPAIFQEHKRVAKTIAQLAGKRFRHWSNTPDPERTIKIGYVSGDLRRHPVGFFLHPVLKRHNRTQCEVHCYANWKQVDDMTRSLMDAADSWHPIAETKDDALTDQIRHDEIDVLIDLSGHTDGHRLGVFAQHPAPVQVTWLGYLNTTGLEAMDYRLCDRYTDPEDDGTDELNVETLYRLSHSQWCYAPHYDAPLVDLDSTRTRDAVLFGSFNQYPKISDPCLDLWCRILNRIPDAKFVAYAIPTGKTQDAFQARLAARGISPDRVSIHDRVPTRDYLAAIGMVDVALDPFPYNGATTTLDTLLMGVPIVALRGERGISRGGYSILQSMNASELIAENPDEYVDLNVRLARDAEWRRALRATLRDRLRTSPLMDVAIFVADLEAAYRFMWEKWCTTSRAIV